MSTTLGRWVIPIVVVTVLAEDTMGGECCHRRQSWPSAGGTYLIAFALSLQTT